MAVAGAGSPATSVAVRPQREAKQEPEAKKADSARRERIPSAACPVGRAEPAAGAPGQPDPPPRPAEAGTAPEGQARAADLGRRRRAARRDPRGRPRRRGLPRAAGAPLDRRQHLSRHRRQRPPRHGGSVRRDRPGEERLPLRRRDRGTRARGQAPPRQEDHRPDRPRPGDPRAGRQGSDEDEGRAAHHRDLAARALPRLRPAGRGPRRLAPARRRRARAPEGDHQGARSEGRRDHRPHRRRGCLRRGHRARPRLPPAALEDDPGEGEGGEGARARLPGGRAAAADRPGSLRRRLRGSADRSRAHLQADRRLPEEDLAAHARAGSSLQGEDAALRGHRCRRRDPLHPLAPRRAALRRLPDLRLRRGVHRDRRQHRPLRRLALQDVAGAARGHDHEEQPRGGQGGRASAAAARHRRDHRHRLHRHGESRRIAPRSRRRCATSSSATGRRPTSSRSRRSGSSR